jgi:hypothetical protein
MFWVILLWLCALSLGTLIHELGHLAAVRLARYPVLRLKLGVGPVILRFRIGSTEYCLDLLPIAGYIMTPGKEAMAALEASGERESFFQKNPDLKCIAEDPSNDTSNGSPWIEGLIYAAGPCANGLLAGALFCSAPMVSERGTALYEQAARSSLVESRQAGEAKSASASAPMSPLEQVWVVLFYSSILLGVSQLLPLPGSDGWGMLFSTVLGCIVLLTGRTPDRVSVRGYVNQALLFALVFSISFISGLIFL